MPKNRVAIIIDGPNFFWSTEELGIRISFPAFLESIWRKHGPIVIKKIYFDENENYTGENTFQQAMQKFGFSIIMVPRKIYHRQGQENGKKPKSRTDSWILVEVTEHLVKNEFDILVLFTGDSDYEKLLILARAYNKQVIIVSAKNNLAYNLQPYGEVILLENQTDNHLTFPAPPKEGPGDQQNNQNAV